MRDLHRQAEDIGDLSRADLKYLTINQSKGWQESLPQGGPLVSHSLSPVLMIGDRQLRSVLVSEYSMECIVIIILILAIIML